MVALTKIPGLRGFVDEKIIWIIIYFGLEDILPLWDTWPVRLSLMLTDKALDVSSGLFSDDVWN